MPKVLEPEVIQLFTIPYCLNNISMRVTLFDVHNTVHVMLWAPSSPVISTKAEPHPTLLSQTSVRVVVLTTSAPIPGLLSPGTQRLWGVWLATGPPVPSCLPGKCWLLTRDLAQLAVLPDVALRR